MKSNIRAQTAQNQRNNFPTTLIHNLFGSLDNPGALACDPVSDYNITQVDIRNYGLSPRDLVMNCPAMAQNPVDALNALRVDKATFIGHSMGDKAVMALTALTPGHIDKPAAVDIAPVDRHARRHDEISAAISAISESDAQTRQQAAAIMRQHLNEEGVIQFLLKSFVDGEWCFSISVLRDQYPHIMGQEKIPTWDHPTLFIPGGNSPYASEQYRDDSLAQFPQTRAHVIVGTDHWVHTEKPNAILYAIRRYLDD